MGWFRCKKISPFHMFQVGISISKEWVYFTTRKTVARHLLHVHVPGNGLYFGTNPVSLSLILVVWFKAFMAPTLHGPGSMHWCVRNSSAVAVYSERSPARSVVSGTWISAMTDVVDFTRPGERRPATGPIQLTPTSGAAAAMADILQTSFFCMGICILIQISPKLIP